MLISCIRLASGRCGVRRRIILSLLSGLFVSAITTPPVLAQAAMPGHVVAAHPHDAHIAEASQRFGIPTTWIIAVMRTESAGDVRAISSAGAMGLMQVMPDTWADLRIRHALGRDPFEPRDNILAGTAYLRAMLDRYGSVGGMLAAYNAGSGRYDAYLSEGRPLPAETRAYVAMLAPRMDGTAPLPNRATVADWREAALFTDRSAEHSQQNDGSPDADRPPRETGPVGPNSGIFVVRPGVETLP
ncbi:lytic transglycosylase domain-containing protein [Henriciella sp.]|uniref:lytic transglycosylase domain-containing protein n=1 Tax=Henriciella sp. TaxID=1968823 RepID=UPI000C104D89|nr:MAG: lytic transglycosylase [Henriciella sp.]